MSYEQEGRPVDWSILDGFREYQIPGKPDLVEELISTFIESSTKLLTDLENALLSRDFQALKAAAHSLKSSSAGVGGGNLSQICRDLEALTEDEPTIAASLFHQLQAEYRRVETELKNRAH